MNIFASHLMRQGFVSKTVNVIGLNSWNSGSLKCYSHFDSFKLTCFASRDVRNREKESTKDFYGIISYGEHSKVSEAMLAGFSSPQLKFIVSYLIARKTKVS